MANQTRNVRNRTSSKHVAATGDAALAPTAAQATSKTISKTIPEQVGLVRNHKLSRRNLIVGLTALGVTAGAAATIAAASRRPTAAQPQGQQQHLQQHDQHVASQTRGDIGGHMADYAEHAIVDDPLFAGPFVGKRAVTTRFAAEVAAVPNRTLRITNRVVHGNQLIVEWVAAGTYARDFLGVGLAGRAYELTGVTVVVREGGKIVRESHYFDAADLRRQIEG